MDDDVTVSPSLGPQGAANPLILRRGAESRVAEPINLARNDV